MAPPAAVDGVARPRARLELVDARVAHGADDVHQQRPAVAGRQRVAAADGTPAACRRTRPAVDAPARNRPTSNAPQNARTIEDERGTAADGGHPARLGRVGRHIFSAEPRPRSTR